MLGNSAGTRAGGTNGRPWARWAWLGSLVLVVSAACDSGDDTVRPFPGDGETGAKAGAGGARSGGAGGSSAGTSAAGNAANAGSGGAGQGAGSAGASGGSGGTAGQSGGAAGTNAGAGGLGGTNGAGFGGASVAGSGGASAGGGSGATSGGAGGAVSCGSGLGAGVDPARVVFVAADAAPNGDGTMDKPLAKMQEGLVVAIGKGGATVIVAEGTYAENLSFGGLAPTPGTVPTVVRGGYLRSGKDWSEDCAGGNLAERTVIAPTSGIPVTFTNVSNDSGLERLRVIAPKTNAPAADDAGVAGVSSIAIVVRGADAKVRVLTSLVEASDAQAALAPKKPTAAGVGKCLGTAATCGNGADGAPAPAPADTTAVEGTFLADGAFTPATGFLGTKGGDAVDGTAGGAGPATNVPSGCGKQPFPPQPQLCLCVTQQKSALGNDGRCGCGGDGGRAGIAGRGGGASAGIVVTGAQATLRLEGSTVKAGKGGDGALGTEGGDGGVGSNGAEGAPREEPGISCACAGAACGNTGPLPCGTVCPTIAVAPTVLGGTAGGAGGKGAKGSKAGDGSGGPSCALVLLGGATLEKDAATTLTPGTPGKGAGMTAAGKTGGTCNF